LLVAYDSKITELEDQTQSSQKEISELKTKCEEIIAENERLYKELTESAQTKLQQTPKKSPTKAPK
jgi:regulator of replication initiation timing